MPGANQVALSACFWRSDALGLRGQPGHVAHGHSNRVEDISAHLWPVKRDYPNARYLEVGWGDHDAYRKDLTCWIAFKAAMWPTRSVLQLDAFEGSLDENSRGKYCVLNTCNTWVAKSTPDCRLPDHPSLLHDAGATAPELLHHRFAGLFPSRETAVEMINLFEA
jgi:hypothetical protein